MGADEPAVRRVTVACDNALLADVLATALRLHGIEAHVGGTTGSGPPEASTVIDPVGSQEQTVGDLVDVVRGGVGSARGCPAGRPAPYRAVHLITSREQQILELVASGSPDDSVASELGISVRTVRAHLQSIRVKLGARNRFAAVACARERGLLPGPDATGSRSLAGVD